MLLLSSEGDVVNFTEDNAGDRAKEKAAITEEDEVDVTENTIIFDEENEYFHGEELGG